MTIEELIEQEMEAYSEGDYAKFSHTRERITAFAALVAEAAVAAEREAIRARGETK